MEFPDLHYPNDTTPYPPHPEVLRYLQKYADTFDLRRHTKFNHLVIRVNPIENHKWEVIIRDLVNDKFIIQYYDAVFVCNGHYFDPFIPEIRGAAEFNGKLLHSHDYRSAETFRGTLPFSNGLSICTKNYEILSKEKMFL